jgi:CheY-like chemotaxis protein
MPVSVMVIDNDQHILALLDEILTLAGYEAHLYTYGLPDRVELLRVRPALIVCDYLLDGDEVGQELWEVLAREPALAQTRLLLCSTFAEYLAQPTGWCKAAGVLIVAKPFDVDEFLCAVHHALVSPQLKAPGARLTRRPVPSATTRFTSQAPQGRLNTRIGA